MPQYLFVYGTLHPDRAPAQIASAVARLIPVGTGTIRGHLLDLGDYPGVILNTPHDEQIHGTIFALPTDPDVSATTLSDLDHYEDYRPTDPNSSLFLRVAHPATGPDGTALDCWLYVYNRDIGTR